MATMATVKKATQILTQETYKPVVDAWNQLNIFCNQSILNPRTPVPITDISIRTLMDYLVENEINDSQRALATTVRDTMLQYAGFAMINFTSSTPVWTSIASTIQQGLNGSVALFSAMPAKSFAEQQSVLNRYTFTQPVQSTQKSGETATTVIPAESSIPGWVIPAAIGGVVLIGGLYWYMNKGQ